MLYQIVSIVCGLITPRLILSAFGSTYNGVVGSAKQFLSLVNILNIGIAGATRVALYKTLASDDREGTSRIIKATKNYMAKVGMAIVIYVVVLMALYPLLSHNNLSPRECALIIGIVGLSTFAEYFFGITNKTLLSADQSAYITSTLNIIAQIANTLVTACLIKLGCNVFTVQLGSAIVFFLSPLVLNIYVKHKYELDDECEPDNSAIEQRGAVAVHSIADIIHNNTDILLLTLFTDAKEISVYTVYYLVAGKMKSLLKVITSGMEAAFGNMWAKKELKRLGEVFEMFEFALFSFTTVTFTCMGLLFTSFVKLYTTGVNDIEYVRLTLAILITVTEAAYCIRQPYRTIVQAAGKYEETKKGAALEAAVNICASLILINFLGIEGVIIGTLLANLIRTTQLAVFSSKHIISRPVMHIVKRCIVELCVCAVSVLAVLFIRQFMPPIESWGLWIIHGFVSFAVCLLTQCAAALVFYRNDLVGVFTILMPTIKKKVANSSGK